MELGVVRDEWGYGALNVFENKDGRTMVHIMCMCLATCTLWCVHCSR